MGKDLSLEHPWQKSPTQLIRFAEELMNKESDFNHQVAFLLIDVGVETMFITYLSLPDDVTGAVTHHWEREQKIAKGSFYILLKSVEEAAGQRLEQLDLNKVLYFHNIRNKLYHFGDGIVPTNDNLQEYMIIAQSLLRTLLGVDLSITSDDFEEGFNNALNSLKAWRAIDDVEICITDLRCDTAVAVEHFRPDWAKRSIEKRLRDIWKKYPDEEIEEHWIRTEIRDNRIKSFNEILGIESDNSWFIDKALQDITYLHLASISEKLNKDTGQELEKYSDACKFLDKHQSRESEDYEEIISRSVEIIDWVGILQEEIDRLIMNESD